LAADAIALGKYSLPANGTTPPKPYCVLRVDGLSLDGGAVFGRGLYTGASFDFIVRTEVAFEFFFFFVEAPGSGAGDSSPSSVYTTRVAPASCAGCSTFSACGMAYTASTSVSGDSAHAIRIRLPSWTRDMFSCSQNTMSLQLPIRDENYK
jgi:hypothetical protein